MSLANKRTLGFKLRLFRLSLIATLLLVATPIVAEPLCGKIKSGALSIPSYSFIVLDKEGKQIPNLHVDGKLTFIERTWSWHPILHRTPIRLHFDPKSGYWVSEPVDRVQIATRNQIWRLKPRCLDTIEAFRFVFQVGEKFSLHEGYQGSFVVSIGDKTIGEVNLPDPTVPKKITLKTWNGKEIF